MKEDPDKKATDKGECGEFPSNRKGGCMSGRSNYIYINFIFSEFRNIYTHQRSYYRSECRALAINLRSTISFDARQKIKTPKSKHALPENNQYH